MKQNIYILFLLIICGIPEKQDPGLYEDPGPQEDPRTYEDPGSQKDPRPYEDPGPHKDPRPVLSFLLNSVLLMYPKIIYFT